MMFQSDARDPDPAFIEKLPTKNNIRPHHLCTWLIGYSDWKKVMGNFIF